MPAPVIDLSHNGTASDDWRRVVRSLPPWNPAGGHPQRLIVVAPHPDDETIGVGGMIAEAGRRGMPVVVVSLTDGEAASPANGLADRRHAELLAALECLVPGGVDDVVRCRLPDGGLAGRQAIVAEIIEAHTSPGDLVVAPLWCDGHPDHDAVGEAAMSLVSRRDIEVGFFPIWAWHWHDPETTVIATGGRREDLSPVDVAAKAAALSCFHSQTSEVDPVLPEHFLRRLVDPHEVIVQPCGAARSGFDEP